MTDAQKQFVDTVSPLAQEDWKVHRILPSLTLAQAIIESASGTSELAVSANNLFGIKGGDSRWPSPLYLKVTKEFVNGQYVEMSRPFRKYTSWQASVYDHGEFLQAPRYSSVVGEKDYKRACQAIKDAGYATSPTYVSTLVNCIEQNKLYTYDDVQGGTSMTGSALVSKIMPAYTGNYSKSRAANGGSIKEITVHHVAGNSTIEALGRLWQTAGRNGSSHYGVQYSNIGQYVSEDDVAWTNSNFPANCRAVTIETSNNTGAPEWGIAPDTFETLCKLVADIAKRNNLGTLVFGKNLNLTVHQFYASTACPGPTLLGKMHELADKANAINNSTPVVPTPEPPPQGILYRVQTGAFTVKANAMSQQQAAISKGFVDAYIKQEEGFYKVQTGAFTVKANADAQLAAVKGAGFPSAYIIASSSSTSKEEPVQPQIVAGTKVRVNQGAKYTNGGTPAPFVYNTVYTVMEPPSGNRVVVGIPGQGVTGAFNMADLTAEG